MRVQPWGLQRDPYQMPASNSYVRWLVRAASSTKLTLLRKLAVQTVVYHPWKQRNNLIHNQTIHTSCNCVQGHWQRTKEHHLSKETQKAFRLIHSYVVEIIWSFVGLNCDPPCFFFLFAKMVGTYDLTLEYLLFIYDIYSLAKKDI